MEHTARDAKARYDAGKLDAFWGDGSAYDFSAWPWVGSRGYRFLDISEEVMQRLEAKGLRRQVTPAGFVPGLGSTLMALDDSHIVLTCRANLDDELAYLLAKAIDDKKRDIELTSIQIDYDNGEAGGPADDQANVLVIADGADRPSVGRADHRSAAAPGSEALLPRTGVPVEFEPPRHP